MASSNREPEYVLHSTAKCDLRLDFRDVMNAFEFIKAVRREEFGGPTIELRFQGMKCNCHAINGYRHGHLQLQLQLTPKPHLQLASAELKPDYHLTTEQVKILL